MPTWNLSRLLAALLATTAALAAQSFGPVLLVPSEYPTIQSAIDAAPNGATVAVEPGVYQESIRFKGKAITVEALAGPYETTITTNGAGRCVIFNMGEGPSSVLIGFRLYQGVAPPQLDDSGLPGAPGGGIYCYGTSPLIRSCIIELCRAGRGALGLPAAPGGHGGGLAAIGVAGGAYSSPTLANCVFMYCAAGGPGAASAAGGHGGAVYLKRSAATLVNCTISGCVGGWSSGTPGRAGGIYLDTLTSGVTIKNTILFRNHRGGPAIGDDGPVEDTFPASPANLDHCALTGAGFGTNIHADPDFIGPRDLRIDPLSPCVDAGTPVSALLVGTTDIDWDPRVIGGAIDIGADELPPPLNPGTGEALVLRTVRDDQGALRRDPPHLNVKHCTAGEPLELLIHSPPITFGIPGFELPGPYVGTAPLLIGQVFPTAAPLAPTVPAVYFDWSRDPAPALLLGGAPHPIFAILLPEDGLALNLQVPPGLAGLSALFQAFVADPFAANGLFAATDAHEIRIVP